MTEVIKIAVVTDDGETVSAHFGRAKFYAIYALADGKITLVERVEKPSHHHGHVHQPGQDTVDEAARHADMFAPLQGCGVVITRGMGYGAHTGLTAIGVRPIITDIVSIAAAIQAYRDGDIVDHPERLH